MTAPRPNPHRHRAVPHRRRAVILFALLCLVGSSDTSARACLFAMTADAPPKLCLRGDDEIDFQNYARTFRSTFYPFERLTLDPGDVLYLSDRPRLTGRLWRISQSMEKAALIAAGITPEKIASAVLAPVACFYGDDRLRGKQSCVAPGEIEPSFVGLDGKISSIHVPSGLGARIYTENGAKGRDAALRRSVDQTGLRKLGMDDAIRSAQIARISIRCRTDCAIPEADAYDLPAQFSDAWTNFSHGHPQLGMTFRIDAEARAIIEFGNGLYIQLMHTGAVITTFWPHHHLAALSSHHTARYITVAMEFRPGQGFDVQLIRSDADRRYIDATLIHTLPWPTGLDQVISVRNVFSPRALIRADLSVNTVDPLDRVTRDATCHRQPVLAVGNAFLRGCAQAGVTESPVPVAQIPAPPADLNPPATLVRTFADAGNPLAVAAASRLCRVSMDQIFNARPMRGVPNWSACVSRTTLIISLYQTMFPDRWNLEQFSNIVRDALDHGHMPDSVQGTLPATQFVNAVRERVSGVDRRYEDAIAAFHQANVLHAYSLARNMDMLAALEHPSEEHAPDCAALAGSSEAIARTQRGMIGEYLLDLTAYISRTVTPRVWRQGALHDSPEPFTFVHAGPQDMELLVSIRALMQNWSDTYLREFSATVPLDVPPTEVCSAASPQANLVLAMSGASIANGIEEATHEAETGSHFVVVSFQGSPVAVLYGKIPPHGEFVAESRFLVSAPRSVLERHAEGAVRGAGLAASDAFVRHAASRGMTAVRAYAVTAPSVAIKHRMGYRLVD
ncbi:hypothetical protein [Cupriavidus pampae]|uniref:Uncharacterized protein n=1 Tax=Cupriavidus pampae TaxID=659251 RepID=A0ABM8XMB8_9BURK|nr:hypothetical protein [Cupriavidus pampae]CAG9181378.1 hypothetical protein LMG32289_04814 [Cupriavidus pampae]